MGQIFRSFQIVVPFSLVAHSVSIENPAIARCSNRNDWQRKVSLGSRHGDAAPGKYIFFNGERIARVDRPSGTVNYYFSDDLQSTSTVTSPSGTIQGQYYYYPYGGLLTSSGGDPNHYLFTGKERDNDSGEFGFDYFGARYYGNSFGRFITADWEAKPTAVPYASFGNPQSLNLYSYVNNNPTTTRDPDGHIAIADDVAVGVIVVTAMAVSYLESPQGQRQVHDAVTGTRDAAYNLGVKIGHYLSSDNSKTAPASQSESSGTSRHEAMNDAKRDAGVPTSQQPEKQERVPVTDSSGRQAMGGDGKPETSREYTHTTGTGEKVVIQDHSQGHTFADGTKVGPHVNVRPASDTRHGQVSGTQSHYMYDAPKPRPKAVQPN